MLLHPETSVHYGRLMKLRLNMMLTLAAASPSRMPRRKSGLHFPHSVSSASDCCRPFEEISEAVIRWVGKQMDVDRKIGPLKQLQGDMMLFFEDITYSSNMSKLQCRIFTLAFVKFPNIPRPYVA